VGYLFEFIVEHFLYFLFGFLGLVLVVLAVKRLLKK